MWQTCFKVFTVVTNHTQLFALHSSKNNNNNKTAKHLLPFSFYLIAISWHADPRECYFVGDNLESKLLELFCLSDTVVCYWLIDCKSITWSFKNIVILSWHKLRLFGKVRTSSICFFFNCSLLLYFCCFESRQDKIY